ncbi:hypothetical protein RQP54_03405 [Curvibacter sp. APW13]|uniref:bacteriohemerythrin n=1 Tax=Curvibacter sp. APW13 TaxID=3077236 RepID=UPI0028DEB9F5|nr:hypothetical protein [Curvibacter sp. APW13]MDT8989902.1 hypothetical protein [Curvibacter sp. APW13]
MHIDSWSAQLSTENAELDEQHITLIEIGRAVVACVEGSALSSTLCDLLDDFVAMSKLHDGLEEAILARNLCPTLEEHRAIHLLSRKKFEDHLRAEQAGIGDHNALVSDLKVWAEHHISDRDLQVKKYLHAVP